MWIVPEKRLSESELAMIGNNIRPPLRRKRQCPRRRAKARTLAAVNRSLASVGERVRTLHRPLLVLA